MKDLSPSDLKSILHSKRANLYYLEHCRIAVNGGRVEYITEQGAESLYWNIPIANTVCLLLGTGTSITQAAMRELAKAGVLIGFSGGGGTPLFTANQVDVDIEWLQPQSEYRPTQYLQYWVSFWFNDAKRLQAARLFQQTRLQLIQATWCGGELARQHQFGELRTALNSVINTALNNIQHAQTSNDLLAQEAQHTKALYKLACQHTGYQDFSRVKQGKGLDLANRYLDHGNYLAYGLAATAAWVLGLPHGLAILHGKTRRGGLVFDIADIIKDAMVLPHAFVSAMAGEEEQEFRQRLLRVFRENQAMDHMIDCIKNTAENLGHLSGPNA